MVPAIFCNADIHVVRILVFMVCSFHVYTSSAYTYLQKETFITFLAHEWGLLAFHDGFPPVPQRFLTLHQASPLAFSRRNKTQKTGKRL